MERKSANEIEPLGGEPPVEPISWRKRLRTIFIGPPRDLQDRSLYHHISLIAFLAWVGLGADGLSSSNCQPCSSCSQP